MQNMDGHDIDFLLEVPDTPDRFASRRPVNESSRTSHQKEKAREEISSSEQKATAAPFSADEYLFRQAKKARELSSSSQTKTVEFVEKRVPMNSGKRTGIVDLSRKGALPLAFPTKGRDSRRRILGDHEGKESSRQWNGTGITLTPSVRIEGKKDKLNGCNAGLKSRNKGKEIDIPRNGCTSPVSLSVDVNTEDTASSVDKRPCSSSTVIRDRENGEGLVLCNDSELKTIQSPRLISTGHRKLVRNGCISPHNMERCKNVAKGKEDEVQNTGISSHEIHIISPDSEARYADKQEGKLMADGIRVANGQHCGEKARLSRVCSMRGKEVTVIADREDSTGKIEDEGWKTTRNRIRKPCIIPSHDTASISKGKDTSGRLSIQSHDVAVGNRSYVDCVHDDSEVIALQHASNPLPIGDFDELESGSSSMRRKRKLISTRSSIGECSSSTSDDPNNSNRRLLRQPPSLRPIRSRRSQRNDIILDRVIEVDELQSPEASCSDPSGPDQRVSDHSIARAIQVESDEMLARRLQEELYNETPEIGTMEEINARIAQALLHGDSDRRATNARQGRSHSGGASSLSTRLRIHPSSSTRRTNRVRLPPSNRLAQLRRELSRPMMDIEARLNFYEALETAFGDGNIMARSNPILRSQRDFNENDYEMLLALDENNHQHVGASANQINSLPESVIQNVNSDEQCAVCLEPPSIGDTIRHLPCLHKFHKDCIDTWLRRRMSCPICKSGIT